MALTETTAPAAQVPEQTASEARTAEMAQQWADINPCPVCGNNQDEGPEKETRTALHCWSCGFRPGQSVAAGTIAPVQNTAKLIADAVAEMRAGVAEDILAALKSGQVPNVTITPPPAGS